MGIFLVSFQLEDNSYVSTISACDGQRTKNATYTRTGIKNQWGTIVVPFDVNGSGDDYDLYTLSSVSNEELTLNKVSGTLNAGTPALIRIKDTPAPMRLREDATEPVSLTITAANNMISVQGSLEGTPADGITLTGSYSVKDITDEDGYIISNNKFWSIQDIKGTNRVKCAPFRAYLKASAPAMAKQLGIYVCEEDNATGAATIDAIDAITNGDAEYYDLNGRKLNSLQKGVNIVKMSNGKTVKVTIK